MNLLHHWYRLRSSFWFLPSAIVVASTLLGLLMVEFDARLVTDAGLQRWPRLFGAGVQGSRSLLAAIAGSMITVAGTVFSITLVALSLASTQYSSRVLHNFMRDRANQAVLGVFVGIFAYCLVVLRSIYDDGEHAFLPSVAILLGLLLGFGGIGVLVFFIHHIADSIQASRIIAGVRHETIAAIDRLFPLECGEQDPDPADADHGAAPATAQHDDEPAPHDADDAGGLPPAVVFRAPKTGYLQHVEFATLRDTARARGVVLRMQRAVGEFVIEGEPLLTAEGMMALHAPDGFDRAWSVGAQRTLEQDVGFGIRQLVDVALKALSPGSNDSTTAVMCVDALTAIMVRLARRRLLFVDCGAVDGPHVDARDPRFADLLEMAFGQIRRQRPMDLQVLRRLHWALETLLAATPNVHRRGALREQALRLSQVAETVEDPADRHRLSGDVRALLGRFDAGAIGATRA